MKTREALADYQLAQGWPADGYPTAKLVAQVEQQAGLSHRSSPTLSPIELRSVQRNLNALGFDAGDPDGIWGKRSKRALHAYLHANALPRMDHPSTGLAERIAREAGIRDPGSSQGD